jgi:hypothetical protein
MIEILFQKYNSTLCKIVLGYQLVFGCKNEFEDESQPLVFVKIENWRDQVFIFDTSNLNYINDEIFNKIERWFRNANRYSRAGTDYGDPPLGFYDFQFRNASSRPSLLIVQTREGIFEEEGLFDDESNSDHSYVELSREDFLTIQHELYEMEQFLHMFESNKKIVEFFNWRKSNEVPDEI